MAAQVLEVTEMSAPEVAGTSTLLHHRGLSKNVDFEGLQMTRIIFV